MSIVAEAWTNKNHEGAFQSCKWMLAALAQWKVVSLWLLLISETAVFSSFSLHNISLNLSVQLSAVSCILSTQNKCAPSDKRSTTITKFRARWGLTITYLLCSWKSKVWSVWPLPSDQFLSQINGLPMCMCTHKHHTYPYTENASVISVK